MAEHGICYDFYYRPKPSQTGQKGSAAAADACFAVYSQYYIWNIFVLGLKKTKCSNHGEGTHSAKMGADILAENTPNAPQFIGPICLLKPKSLGYY